MLQGTAPHPGFEDYRQHQPKWVPTSGDAIPQGAFPGGRDGDNEVLYIARAFMHGSVQIGKAGRSLNPAGAHIPWDGKEHVSADYDVLVLPPGSERFYRWIPATEGVSSLMSMKKEGRVLPVVGGYEPDGRELYITQCWNDDGGNRSLHPGKFGMHTPAGLYAYGGKERHANSFNILIFDTTLASGGNSTGAQGGSVGAAGGGNIAPTSGSNFPQGFGYQQQGQSPSGPNYQGQQGQPPAGQNYQGQQGGSTFTSQPPGPGFQGAQHIAPVPGGGYMVATSGTGGSSFNVYPGPPPGYN